MIKVLCYCLLLPHLVFAVIQESSRISFQVNNSIVLGNCTGPRGDLWINLMSGCDIHKKMFSSKPLISISQYSTCLAFFDAFYKICKYKLPYENITYDEHMVYDKVEFCHNASDIVKQVEPNLNETFVWMGDWLKHFKKTMMNESDCGSACSEESRVLPVCLVILDVYRLQLNSIEKRLKAKGNETKVTLSSTESELQLPKNSSTQEEGTNLKIPLTDPDPFPQLPLSVDHPETNKISQDSDGIKMSNSDTLVKGNADNSQDGRVEDSATIGSQLGPDQEYRNENVENQELDDFGLKENPPKDDGSPLVAQVSHPSSDNLQDDSNFFSYFIFMVLMMFIVYVLYHNKNKVIALLVEGRRSRTHRGGRDSRHSSTSYSKLNSNLEETVSNSCAPSVTHVHY